MLEHPEDERLAPSAVQDAVECRSDSTYAERPVAFTFQEQRFEVAEVLSRWRTPEGTCFRVRAYPGQVFELFYLESLDGWSIREV